ncbi:MAG: conserved rane protein of unknown function [Oscillospiraceae bacterium]|jgi:hypothetical protein|nr:conserved rane protein of unknown function [Oscillospiraceae bacterium]
MKQKLKQCALPLLAVLLISVFPVLFLYFTNAGEVDFADAMQPLAVFSALGLAVFFISWLASRSCTKAAIIGGVFMLFFSNFALLERGMKLLLPELRYWHCLAIILVVLLHLIVLFVKKIPQEGLKYTVNICCLVFGVLTVMNFVMAVPTISKKMAAQQKVSEEKNKLLSQNNQQIGQPNIYYFILDEYSGFETVKNILGYDNEPFAKHLESIGFAVSRNSYNEGANTAVVTANLMSLEYVANDRMGKQELDQLRQNGAFLNLLLKQGYSLQGAGADSYIYGLNRLDAQMQNTPSKTVGGESFTDILFAQTMIYPFGTVDTTREQEDILRTYRYLETLEVTPNASMFIMTHMVFPHEPFLFDQNGKPVTKENQTNWKDLRYYLGQYKYSTKLTSNLMEVLLKKDPSAIIILQSDHSARASSDKELVRKLIPPENMKNILNAVYFSGEAFPEIQSQSGVNTLRLLLNRLFGYKFDILEVPGA